MFWDTDNFVLNVAQCAAVALPAAGLPRWTERWRSGAWALVLPLCIGVVVGAIALVPWTADVLTWVALLLVPVGAALALGWAMRGGRRWLAPLAGALLALAWADQDSRAGQVATTLLVLGSAVTLGRLLAGAAPLILLELGVVAMAVVDAILVFSGGLEHPNAVLVAAEPGAGLPQLQSAAFGTWSLGYGDFFAAAVVGGILAARDRPRVAALAALAMVPVSVAWDQLFAVYDTLPATIPPAIVLIGAAIGRRWRPAVAPEPEPEPAEPQPAGAGPATLAGGA